MYYAIEGTSGVVDFATKYVTKQGTVLFGEECLADIDSIIKSSNGK
jgi:hypothetical protein